MRLWPFGRASRSDDDGASAPVDAPASPLSVPAAEGPGPEAGVDGATSTAAAPSRPAAPAWRLLDPPVLQSAEPMPRTFDAHVERSLAAHLPVPQLAATARPLGHEVRRSAPVGVMGEVLRVVGTDAASIAPAVLGASDDLVLRPLRAATDDSAPDSAPTFGGGPARTLSTPSVVPSAVSRSVDGAAPTTAPGAVSGGVAPTPAGDPVVPTVSTGSAAPARVLRAAAEVDAPLVGSLLTSPGPRLSTLLARTVDPTPDVPGASDGALDLPVISAPPQLAPPIRRRMAIEVRDPSVPVTLDAFDAPRTVAPAAPVAAPVVRREVDEPEEIARQADDEVDDDVQLQRAVADSAETTPTRPTLGGSTPRVLGLGAPLQRLPESAMTTPPEDDPFAGWSDAEPMSLPSMPPAPGAMVSRSADDTVVERSVDEASAAGAGGSSGSSAPIGAPSTTAIARTVDGGDDGSGDGSDVTDGTMSSDPLSLSPVRPIVAQRAPLLPGVPEPIAALGGPVAAGPAVVPVAWPGSAPSTVGGGAGAPGPGAAPGVVRRSADGSTLLGGSAGSVTTSAPATSGGTAGGARAAGATSSSGPLAPIARTVLADAPSVDELVAAASLPASGGAAAVTGAGSWGGDSRSAAPSRVSPAAASAGFAVAGTATLSSRSTGPAVPLRRLVDGGSTGTLGASSSPAVGSIARALGDVGPDAPDDGGVGPLPVAAMRMPEESAGSPEVRRSTEGSVTHVSAHAVADHGGLSSDGAVVQRDAVVEESSASAAAPGDAGAPPAAGQAGGGAAPAQSDAELDQLAGRLYDRIRHRLRRELLDDRERAGISIDRVR